MMNTITYRLLRLSFATGALFLLSGPGNKTMGRGRERCVYELYATRVSI